MKQQLDECRTLAIKLFEAGEAEKLKQPKHIWDGQTRTWRDLPSESVAMWDAIAIRAFGEVRREKQRMDWLLKNSCIIVNGLYLTSRESLDAAIKADGHDDQALRRAPETGVAGKENSK